MSFPQMNEYAKRFALYIAALQTGDTVSWREYDDREDGTFLRREEDYFIVNVPRRATASRVHILDFFIACCKCGCTDDRACAGGCSWIDIKTCSCCAPSTVIKRKAA